MRSHSKMASLASLTSFLTESINSNTTFLLLGSTIAILFYFWINSGPDEHELFAKRNVKHYRFGNLLIGMLRKTRFETVRDEIFKKEGMVLGAIQIGRPTIYMANPEMAQQVLVKNFTSFTNRRVIKIADPVFNESLFMLSDKEKWKRVRSIVTPTFANQKLKMMKPILDDTSKTLVDNFSNAIDNANGEPIELKHICGAFTMDTIVQIAFGVKIDSMVDRDNALLKYAKKIFQTDLSMKNLTIMLVTFFLPTVARIFKIRMNADSLDYFQLVTNDIIKNKRKQMSDCNNNNQESKATNFIELLLEAESERLKLEAELEKKKELPEESNDKQEKAIKFMTNDEIMGQCIMFLMVGYDTTATTITLTLYNLTLNQDAQERLYEEIMSTLKVLQLENEENSGDSDDPIKLFTLERIQKMKYLESVIKESLRLYPPATFTERTASEDVTIENGDQPVYVKEGDIVNIPIYTMQRDPAYWNDPESYIPERFMDPNPTFHKYSYLPFSAGPRDCIAKSLAYIEAKIAILHAVRMYKFTKSDKTPIPVEFYYQANLLINKDIHVNIVKR